MHRVPQSSGWLEPSLQVGLNFALVTIQDGGLESSNSQFFSTCRSFPDFSKYLLCHPSLRNVMSFRETCFGTVSLDGIFMLCACRDSRMKVSNVSFSRNADNFLRRLLKLRGRAPLPACASVRRVVTTRKSLYLFVTNFNFKFLVLQFIVLEVL